MPELVPNDQPREEIDPENVISQLSGDSFARWYDDREFRRNILEGQPYFNEPSKSHDPGRHSPSSLLNCHRKQFYRQLCSPRETASPDGIFWFGTAFEEQIVLPFIQDLAAEIGGYVRKHDWIDYSTEVDNTELRFKGRTDPLIVDSDSVPVVPIEVKTRKSVESLDSPSRKHKAQLHAYMVGLSRKYEIRPPDGAILYGSRETFDVKTFHVEYSEPFWDEVVVRWAATQTNSLIDETLPPADPEQEWECGYCPYRERCGKGKSPVKDSGAYGFVPKYRGYPRENVEEYLRLFPSATITPALASKFPDIASKHSIQAWSCDRCGYCAEWDAVKSAGEPLCPQCAEDDILIALSQPEMPTVAPDE